MMTVLRNEIAEAQGTKVVRQAAGGAGGRQTMRATMARKSMARQTMARKSMAAGGQAPQASGRKTLKDIFSGTNEEENAWKQACQNKWIFEVGWPRLFHVCYVCLFVISILWFFSLVFFMNPHLVPCSGVKTDPVTGKCVYTDGVEDTSCLSWEDNKDYITPLFSWVEVLQPINFFEKTTSSQAQSKLVSTIQVGSSCFGSGRSYCVRVSVVL